MCPSSTSWATDVMPDEPLERKFSTARWASGSSLAAFTWPNASAEIITPCAVSTSGQRTETENTSRGRVSTVSTNGITNVPPPTWRRYPTVRCLPSGSVTVEVRPEMTSTWLGPTLR